VKIDEERIDRYVAERKAQPAANGTINRELTTLKRAFRLAKKLKRVAAVPEIAMLAEATPRQGFVEHAEFSRLLSHLSDDLRAPLVAAYITGWRLASEIFTGSGSTSTSRLDGFAWSPGRPRTAMAACSP
jgi:site-specific recombinase XerD